MYSIGLLHAFVMDSLGHSEGQLTTRTPMHPITKGRQVHVCTSYAVCRRLRLHFAVLWYLAPLSFWHHGILQLSHCGQPGDSGQAARGNTAAGGDSNVTGDISHIGGDN